MSYYYKNTEPGLWTVGTDDANGKWIPESDHGSPEEAAEQVACLNGGGSRDDVADRLGSLETRIVELAEQIQALVAVVQKITST